MPADASAGAATTPVPPPGNVEDEFSPLRRHLRRLAHAAVTQLDHGSAAYYCDKLVSLPGCPSQDVFHLARVLHGGGEHARALHVLDSRGFLEPSRFESPLRRSPQRAFGAKVQAMPPAAREFMLDAPPLSPSSCGGVISPEGAQFFLLAASCMRMLKQWERCAELLEKVMEGPGQPPLWVPLEAAPTGPSSTSSAGAQQAGNDGGVALEDLGAVSNALVDTPLSDLLLGAKVALAFMPPEPPNKKLHTWQLLRVMAWRQQEFARSDATRDGGGGRFAAPGGDRGRGASSATLEPATICASDGSYINSIAQMCALRGEALLELDNRSRAAQWFLAAVRLDPYVARAVSALSDHHLLSDDQEEKLQTLLKAVLTPPVQLLPGSGRTGTAARRLRGRGSLTASVGPGKAAPSAAVAAAAPQGMGSAGPQGLPRSPSASPSVASSTGHSSVDMHAPPVGVFRHDFMGPPRGFAAGGEQEEGVVGGGAGARRVGGGRGAHGGSTTALPPVPVQSRAASSRSVTSSSAAPSPAVAAAAAPKGRTRAHTAAATGLFAHAGDLGASPSSPAHQGGAPGTAGQGQQHPQSSAAGAAPSLLRRAESAAVLLAAPAPSSGPPPTRPHTTPGGAGAGGEVGGAPASGRRVTTAAGARLAQGGGTAPLGSPGGSSLSRARSYRDPGVQSSLPASSRTATATAGAAGAGMASPGKLEGRAGRGAPVPAPATAKAAGGVKAGGPGGSFRPFTPIGDTIAGAAARSGADTVMAGSASSTATAAVGSVPHQGSASSSSDSSSDAAAAQPPAAPFAPPPSSPPAPLPASPLLLDRSWLFELYSSRLRRYAVSATPINTRFFTLEHSLGLSSNPDVQFHKAEALFYQHDPSAALAVSTRAFASDPLHRPLATLHYTLLVSLKRSAELFRLAHAAAAAAPREALSWYAVGCYYLSVGKNAEAIEQFTKATRLDPTFAPAWMGMGQAFAAQDASEAALAAYRAALKLWPNCHIPPLAMATLSVKLGLVSLARQYLALASFVCPTDPLLYHEMGVLEYRLGNYDQACSLLETAAAQVRGLPIASRATWEPTLLVLGHTYRKMGDLTRAVEVYTECLRLLPQSSVTLSSLGFARLLQGNNTSAIELFHQALSVAPDDSIAQRLLATAISDDLEAGVDLPAAPSVSPPPPRRLPAAFTNIAALSPVAALTPFLERNSFAISSGGGGGGFFSRKAQARVSAAAQQELYRGPPHTPAAALDGSGDGMAMDQEDTPSSLRPRWTREGSAYRGTAAAAAAAGSAPRFDAPRDLDAEVNALIMEAMEAEGEEGDSSSAGAGSRR